MSIVDKGPYKGLRFPKRQINASPGEDRLRCGKCAGMDFEAHVQVVGSTARITALICLGCLKIRKIDPRGFIEGTGMITVNPRDDYAKPPLTTRN